MIGETPTPREQSLALSSDPEWPRALDDAWNRMLLKWARSQKRFWYYDRASRQPDADEPDWRSPRLPWFGGDEYGRKTIVIPIPFHGALVWAFWTWKGAEDNEMRTQEWDLEIKDKARPRLFEDTLILVEEYPFVDVKHNLDDCDLRWTMHVEGDEEILIECAVYPLDWNTLRLYPVYGEDVTVTVRIEVGEVGTGIQHLSERWPHPMALGKRWK